MFMHSNYNPDVLSCLANLSSDEVFTPPDVANRILDDLPQDLFKSPNTTFLDPCTKSGVFLREIAKRLLTGLKTAIPDVDERIEHIFTKQLYGIATTELTALISRRTVYCSKTANGEFSIVRTFGNADGNIIYNPTQHSWKNGKCIFCNAREENYARGEETEDHAYQFIHTDNPKEIFNMDFDVVVGNPPYQLNDGGGMGTSATPLYQKFVGQGKGLDPRYLSMIIPARWYSGGKGLDEFRKDMLSDSRVSRLVDYFDSSICFPNVNISGGICYFLWKQKYDGDCEVVNISWDNEDTSTRPLLEADTESFIRFNDSVAIAKKVKSKGEESFANMVSARKPFGFSHPNSVVDPESPDAVKVYTHRNTVYTSPDEITQNLDEVMRHKIFIAKARGESGVFPSQVLGKPFIGEPNSCCSETYLLISAGGDLEVAKNIIAYISTRFFRFLVLLKKNTQNAPRGVYELVPMQDFQKEWTDAELYKKYRLSKSEISHIESLVKPMGLGL